MIGKLIKIARIDLGWKQQDLADRAQITRANLSRIENGKMMPTMATLARLIQVMPELGKVKLSEAIINAL